MNIIIPYFSYIKIINKNFYKTLKKKFTIKKITLFYQYVYYSHIALRCEQYKEKYKKNSKI
jgi:hypothetical protein